MNIGRHGGRLLVLLTAICLIGCDRRPSPKGAAKTARPGSFSAILEPAFSRSNHAAVSRISWGGVRAPRRLAVLWSDGRFAVYRSEGEASAVSVGPVIPERSATAVALISTDRLVTGDRQGLELWDVSRSPAKSLYRRECDPVTALSADTENEADPAFLAGLADGRVLRFRLRFDDRIEKPASETRADPSRSAVASLLVLPGKGEVISVREDGYSWRLQGNWQGPPSPPRQARAVATGGGVLARLIDGPAVAVSPLEGSPPSRLFHLPRPAGSVALLRNGSVMVVGGEGGCWIIPIPPTGPIRSVFARASAPMEGSVVVAADPADREARRLALGDGSGRVEILDREVLEERSSPMTLDDAPDLAFLPQERLGRSRNGVAESKLPLAVRKRIEGVRTKLDRREMTGLSPALRELQDDPAMTKSAMPEILALAASVEQITVGATTETAHLLDSSRAGFARDGALDREADLCFWSAWNMVRPVGFEADRRDERTSMNAIALLRQAEALYRKANPPLLRQARLCEAARAWILLDLGEVRAATLTFREVVEAARLDPVLGQVVELDRIAAALAEARCDWPTAAATDLRLLERSKSESRPDLARAAGLNRAGSLAAMGRWKEAAAALEPDRPDDPEWSLRRLAFRKKAGFRIPTANLPSDDDPRDAPSRVVLEMGNAESKLVDLIAAAEIHRRAARDDLATEADLARAELLERIGKPSEALPLYGALARQMRSRTFEPMRRGSRSVLAILARSHRGMARCLLIDRRPAGALAALEAIERSQWAASCDGSLPKSAAIGLSAAEFDSARKLRSAATALERFPADKFGPDYDSLIAEIDRLEASLPAVHRGFLAADPMNGFDVKTLNLSENEAVLVIASTGPEGIAGFLLRGEHEPEAARLAITKSDLARAVQSWRGQLGDGARPLASASNEADELPLTIPDEPDGKIEQLSRPRGVPWERALYDALIGPFETRMIGVNRLVFAPGETLTGFPIEVLGREKRLIQRMSVSYAPSLAFVASGRDERRIEAQSANRALVIASGSEPTGLIPAMKAAGMTADLVVGDAARPDRLVQGSLADYRLIHVTGNASMNARRNPFGTIDLRLRSGGLEPRAGGRLSTFDLASIPLRARVLTLAANDRDGNTSEGLRELARAGMATGAESVLITLWPPPASSVARFFAEFSRNIGAGQAPIRALEAARIQIVRDPKFQDPVHWAGYVLYDVQAIEAQAVARESK